MRCASIQIQLLLKLNNLMEHYKASLLHIQIQLLLKLNTFIDNSCFSFVIIQIQLLLKLNFDMLSKSPLYVKFKYNSC